MSTIECADCAGNICLGANQEANLRENHNTFYCPAGHENYFPGKTKDELRIAELALLLRQEKRLVVMWRDRADKYERTFGSCPVPECRWRSHSGIENRWRSMIRHIIKAHGEMRPEDLMALPGLKVAS